MNQNNVINNISNYYNNLVSKYGHDPRSCDYGHANSQKVKFNVLSQAASYDAKSILDIGCGFADYFDFLNEKFKEIDYHGVDISEMMISEGKKLHPEIKLELRNVFENPPLKKYDIVTANGIFYLLGNDSRLLMYQFIKKMFDMTNDLVVFNSLSTWAIDQVEGEFYADPCKTMAYCKSLSPWITLRHDYHPRDFSIFIYKNRNI
jgi:SAM-dependent methyltransferase